MNLYKIIFSHHSPKNSHRGIAALILAQNHEQVYNYIASEPVTHEDTLYNFWKENEKFIYNPEKGTFVYKFGGEVKGWWDQDGNPENFKDRMLRLKGDIEDDSVDFSDAFYGVTLFGWELLKENITTDYSELIELGVVYNLTTLQS